MDTSEIMQLALATGSALWKTFQLLPFYGLEILAFVLVIFSRMFFNVLKWSAAIGGIGFFVMSYVL